MAKYIILQEVMRKGAIGNVVTLCKPPFIDTIQATLTVKQQYFLGPILQKNKKYFYLTVLIH